MWDDFKYAWRLLAKAPGTSLLTLLALGLGIGTAVFVTGLVHTFWFASLPWPHADRLYSLVATQQGQRGKGVPYLDFAEYKKAQTSFDVLEPVTFSQVTLSGRGYATVYRAAEMGAGMWRLHGVRPMLGRILDAGDEAPNAPAVVVIGERVWREYFNADPAVVGQQVKINTTYRTVVGVMPAGFEFPVQEALWLPFAQLPPERVRKGYQITSLGWLKPGISAEQAQAQLMSTARRLAAKHPGGQAEQDLLVKQFRRLPAVSDEGLAAELEKEAAVIMLVAWIGACNLLLAHTRERRHELAVRAALGAPLRYLVRHLFCEGMLLAGSACLLGLFLAAWALAATPRLVGSQSIVVAYWWHFSIGRVELAVAMALAALSVLIIQFLPAWQLSRVELMVLLRDGSRQPPQFSRNWSGKVIVTAQIAISCVLVTYALSTMYLIAYIRHADRGIHAEGLLQVVVPAGDARSPYQNQANQKMLWHRMEAALRALPGHPPFAMAQILPSRGFFVPEEVVPEGGQAKGQDTPRASVDAVNSRYFETFGIPILSGRAFGEGDVEGAPDVAIVDDNFAKRYWPGQSALGKTLWLASAKRRFTVVGVSRPVLVTQIPGDPADLKMSVYFSGGQLTYRMLEIALGGGGSLQERFDQIRRALAGIDPDHAAQSMGDYGELVAKKGGGDPLASWEIWLDAAGVLMIVTCLYAIHARAVARQARDLHIRRALGAADAAVAMHLGVRTLRQSLPGLVVGSALGWVYAAHMHEFVFPVTRTVVSVCTLGGTLFVSGIVLLAMLIPVRDVLMPQPGLALRYA